MRPDRQRGPAGQEFAARESISNLGISKVAFGEVTSFGVFALAVESTVMAASLIDFYLWSLFVELFSTHANKVAWRNQSLLKKTISALVPLHGGFD